MVNGATKRLGTGRAAAWRNGRAAAVAALTLFGAASGCANYKEKDFTADDECIDCSDKGGLFSGEDGEFTYGF